MSDEASGTEEWREIPGHPNYEVSNLGRVRSWIAQGRHGARRSEPYVMKQYVHNNGYWATGLGNRHLGISVHSLILAAFVGPRPTGHEAAHCNGDPLDNRLDNLRWATPKENGQDRVLHGTSPRGERHHAAKLTWNQVEEIRSTYAAGGGTHRSLGARFGVSKTVIGDICRGTLWQA